MASAACWARCLRACLPPGLGRIFAEQARHGRANHCATERILVTLLWSGLISYLILRVLAATVGLRVDAQEETEGLDLSQHDERGYDF